MVGNGITEPPYLDLIRCPYHDDVYKYPDDECDRLEIIKQEEKEMKLVVIKHEKSERKFLFEVPHDHNVRKGQAVICDTKKGRTEGAAVCDSFEVTESALASLCDVFGATLPLKKIVGEFCFVEWSSEKE